ncbi:hypothetical protein [uncultured Bacteroides sp.]|uniref:hypothetical protein n=1 Tax=uncultured Bacteroides sp. TaxID=162156 RepID=UPI00262B8067|nr:hypothetical protein [uncultured Bacteroides sp.]
MRLNVKLHYYRSFYRATFWRSVLVTCILGCIFASDDLPFERIAYALSRIFPVVGLACDAIFRFLMRKEEFYFYHNGSCSTAELFIVSFIFSCLIGRIGYYIAMFIWNNI